MLTELNSRGFRICELVPKDDAAYLEGSDAKEYRPIDDKRATRLFAALLLANGGVK